MARSLETESLTTLFASNGLVFLGVAAVPGQKEHIQTEQQHYSSWIASKSHGEMTYLERHQNLKYHPDVVVEGTESVLIGALPYYQKTPAQNETQARIARYAWGRDYHKVLLSKLKGVASGLSLQWPDHKFRSFTDTAPIDERFWAEQAGGAFRARNTLAIRADLGSWFLVGEIFSTKAFAPTGPQAHAHGACPSSCKRCVSVCPTGALSVEPGTGAGKIDASRCISYLTIEHKGSIDPILRPLMGNWLFGCDLCQEVCPFNLKAQTTTEPQFLAWKAGPTLDLAEILTIESDSAFTERFGGSPVHRAGRNGLRRNACIVAANMGRVDLSDIIRRLCSDADPVVAETAQWALERLGGSSVPD